MKELARAMEPTGEAHILQQAMDRAVELATKCLAQSEADGLAKENAAVQREAARTKLEAAKDKLADLRCSRKLSIHTNLFGSVSVHRCT